MTILSAAFLGGVLLVAVPIWLHRLRAHSAEQRTFSSLFLMRRSEAPVHMQKRLQHLVLLALRVLLVVVICLAFAEIELDRDVTAPIAAAQPDRIFVVDNSLSMGRRSGGRTALDEAKSEARRLASALPSGVRGAVVVAGEGIEALTGMTDDAVQLEAAIASIEQSASRLSYAGLLGRLSTAARTLVGADAAVSVDLVSDFQASAVPDQFNALVEGASVPIELHRVGEVLDNWSIRSADLFPGESRIRVLLNAASETPRTVRVVLERNDAFVASTEVEMPPQGVRDVSFPVDLTVREPRRWRLMLEVDDALAADDVRYVASVEAAEQTLPVIGGSDESAKYILAAVQAGASRFKPQRSERLTDMTAPVLVVVDPSPGTVAGIEAYLREGGSALLISGPSVRAAGTLPIVGLELAGERMQRSDFGVVAVDRTHPVISGFDAWQGVGVYQALRAREASAGRVILALDDGAPLLEEHGVGAGRLLVLTTALDPEWSSLVVQPTFARLFGNTLSYLAEDVLPQDAVVGQPFAIAAQSVQLFDAAGGRVLGLGDTVGRPAVSLSAPGLYEVRTASRSQPLAVNIDNREAELAFAQPALLDDWAAATRRFAGGVRAPSQAASAQADRFPLAPWLLAALVLLVLAECLTANWLARPREVVA